MSDRRAEFVDALRPARLAAYQPGEFVGQENFMTASEILDLARRSGVAAGTSLLDLCCGVAGPGNHIARELGSVHFGVDQSEEALALARRGAAGLPSQFEQGDILNLAAFPALLRHEVVMLLETVLAFPDKRRLFQAVRDVLLPGGRFLFTLEEGAPLSAAESAVMPRSDTVYPSPLAEVETLLAELGFEILERQEHTASHLQVASDLTRAFAERSAELARALGEGAVEELLQSHRLWVEWMGSGRIRKFSFVARRAYPYTRYLASKKSVDDRALNKDVVDALRRELSGPLQVLEIGAGLGTMVARMLEWGLLEQADYRLLDVDAQLLCDSRDWLARWGAERGRPATLGDETLALNGVDVHFTCAELGEFLSSQGAAASLDLLVANAFLDLVEVPAMLPQLFTLIRPGGLFWFSINFDGDTIFEPEHPDDEEIMRVYHRSMDERVRYGRPAGHSRTGRRLFAHLREAGATVLAAGSSDWVVYPPYPADEATFLHYILDTVEEELRKHPHLEAVREPWIRLRRQQIERAELVYIAHQIDFLGKV